MKAREFIAELGKIPLNHEVTLEAMYFPTLAYNWVFESLTEDVPDIMSILSSGHINFCGLDIFRHTGQKVLCVSMTGVAEVEIDLGNTKILNWHVHGFKVKGTGEIAI